MRYAIGADFHNPASFETHVLGVQKPIVAQFASGGVFDGRYLYFNDGIVGKVARYDTTAPFNSPTSYEYSNCSPPPEDPYAAWGFGSFDGRFVYFVRHDSFGSAFRYDTTQPFATSCEVYRIHLGGTLLNAMPIDDPETVVFDGKRIYVANAGSAPAVAIGQYDLTKPFADRSSWDEPDVPKTRARRGATFDGRYVYFASTAWLAPFDIARYDSTKDFADPKSWELADLEKVAGIKLSHGCSGLVFDGEYVYCVGPDIRFQARSQAVALEFQPSFY